MRPQAFQHGEIRDENDNIVQEGAFGKHSPFANGDNSGILDYLINDLEALYEAAVGNWLLFKSKSEFPQTGDASKLYIANDTGRAWKWNGTGYVEMDQQSVQITAQDVLKFKQVAEAKAKEASESADSASTSAKNAASSASTASTKAAEAANSAGVASGSSDKAAKYANIAQGLYDSFCRNIVGASASTMNNAGILIGASASAMVATTKEET